MSSNNRAPLVIPVLIIALGVGWLLTAQGFAPGVNWIWILGLGVVGILTFVLSKGLDKVSVVLGPFFLLASLLSILRQTGNISLEIEVPVLVISVGVLLLAAQLPAIPKPDWYLDLPAPAEGPRATKKLRLDDATGTPPDRTAERGRNQDAV
jgi:hypothetical protein